MIYAPADKDRCATPRVGGKHSSRNLVPYPTQGESRQEAKINAVLTEELF
jgi:hypothetical protein